MRWLEQVIQALNVSEDVCANRGRVPQLIFQRDLKLAAEAVKRQFHRKAPVLSQQNRIGVCHCLAGHENGRAGVLFSV